MVRLYSQFSLQSGLAQLTPEQTHYVLHVLRLQSQAPISLFNERDGEWLGHLAQVQKKMASVMLVACVRLPQPSVPLHLVFAPLKNDAMQFLIEKATELGVTDFWPVVTRYTVNRFNENRAQANALMATQQCERLDPPVFHEAQKLAAFLQQWPQTQPLLIADERNAKALPLFTALEKSIQGAAFLIGPEGGFAPEDWQVLDSQPFIKRVTLGARILRAETAALMCLGVFQAMVQSR
jgi:16S rRNA (uracil1498-N3)-methyltransferase